MYVVAIEKGDFGSPFTTVVNFTFYIVYQVLGKIRSTDNTVIWYMLQKW